jgi:Fe-S-cluster-containing hydrogenase component 2
MNRSGYFPVDFVDPDSQCNGCKLCAIVCPDIAIRVYK